MKRYVSFFIVFVTVLSLCACSPRRFSLVINAIDVPQEIYNYYLSAAENDEKYSDKKDKEKIALKLCRIYTAENELIKQYGASLSAEEKVSAAADTKAKWLYYSDFYNKNSVSKQTLNLMIEHEKLVENAIIASCSEENGVPLPEEDIRSFYNENYAVVQVISADLTDKSGKIADEETVNGIVESFKEMRNAVRSGEETESAAQRFPEIAHYDGKTTVISAFDNSYPEGLFENVAELKNGETQVYKYSRVIYLIHLVDSEEADAYYSLYSKDCVVRMKKSEFEKTVNTIAQTYKMVYNND